MGPLMSGSAEAVPFDTDFTGPYGKPVQVSGLIVRLLTRNPSPFTFKGTSVTIVGHDQVAVIDPGPDDPEHLQCLRDALRGKRVSHILVTHTHRDHSPAARALKQWTGAPTYGFGPHGSEGTVVVEEGADLDFAPDVQLRDGDRIEGESYSFECVHTPGHTSNHLSYALQQEQALFTGDHVMGWSTTVVAPPDGDMGAYMRSLERLLSRDDRIYWPTHGGPIQEPKAFVSALLRHRRARETQIMQVMRDGAVEIPQIVERVYAGIDPRLKRAAALNGLGHLIKLMQEGRATAEGDALSARYHPTS